MTRKTIALPFSITLVAALIATVFIVFGAPGHSEAAQPASPQIAVALVGTAVAVAGDGGAMCFTIPMRDLRTNKVIGEATDCLSLVGFDGDAVKLDATTTFDFPQGQLVSRGLTTVQPLLHGQANFTNSTGAPAPTDFSNILSGTKAFKKAADAGTGTVRLSGLVNLTDFGFEEGDSITFDCLFIIDLDAPLTG